MKIDTLLNEALDKVYDYKRMDVTTLPPYVVDEYEFLDNGVNHVVRFLKGGAIGKRATIVTFGKRQGKTVVRKYDGVSNILKYLSTVLAIFNEAYDLPNQKMEQKRDGFGIIFSAKLWEKIGPKFQQIFKMKFMGEFRFNKDFHEYFEEDTQMFYFWQPSKSFKGVFNNLEKSLGKPVADATADEADKMISVSRSSEITKQMTDAGLMSKLNATKIMAAPIAKIKPFKEVGFSEIDVGAMFVSPEKNQSKASQTLSATTDSPNGISVDDVAPFDEKLATPYDESPEAMKAAGAVIRKLYDTKYGAAPKLKTISKEEFAKLFMKYALMSRTITLGIIGAKEDNYSWTDQYESILTIDEKPDETELNNDFKSMLLFAHVYDPSGGTNDMKIFGNGDIRTVAVGEGFSLGSANPKLGKKFKKYVSIVELVDIVMKNGTPNLHSDANMYTIEDIYSRVYTNMYGVDSYSKFKNLKLEAGIKVELFSYSVEKELKTYLENYEKNGTKDTLISLISGALGKKDIIKAISDKEYLTLLKVVPDRSRMVGLQTTAEALKEKFLNDWFNTAGSTAQSLAHRVYNKVGIAADLPAYYNSYDTYANNPFDNHMSIQVYMAEKLAAPNIRHSINEIYKRTQQHFQEKYGKKYTTKTVKLYRGVSINDPVAYVPGVFESWSTSLTASKKFSEMTVLNADVPYQAILGSWKTLHEHYGEGAVPSAFKPEHEFIVMGGIFATIPMYRLHYGEPVPIPVGKESIMEWMLNESEDETRELMKIITPKSPEFKDLLARGELALGNDVDLEDSAEKMLPETK